MKILVAGASGAIGRRLVPLLVANGHQVRATTRTPDKLSALRALGAEAVVVDGLNRDSVMRAVVAARPEAIVHQMTSLASVRNLKNFEREFALTNRLRTEGTEHLLTAARAAGTRKFIAQSYAGWPSGPGGDRAKTEEEPLDSAPVKAMATTLAAIRKLENLVTSAAGIAGTVLRYGAFYGPGTSIAQDGDIVKMIRARSFPVVGNGAGIWSFIHVDDAARATLIAIERGEAGLYNVVDDLPVETREWLPGLAEHLGARRPYRIPEWIARLAIGEAGVYMMTKIRGASNAKARQAFGWKPRYSNWRIGFSSEMSPAPDASHIRHMQPQNL